MALDSPSKKLPILTVLFEAGWYVWTMRKAIILAICLPAMASMGAILWVRLANPSSQLFSWVASWFSWALGGLAAISCHRLVLLGHGSVPTWGVSGSHFREWKFIGGALVLGAGFWALAYLVALMGGSAGQKLSGLLMVVASIQTPVFVAVLLLSTSLLLVFPAIATDKKLNVFEAFQLAKGNRLRLAALIYVIPVLLKKITRRIFEGRTDVIWALTEEALYWCVLPFGVAILSLCYKRLLTYNSR